MSTILEQLYRGEIFPAEKIFPNDPAYSAGLMQLNEIVGKWRVELPEQFQVEMEQLENQFLSMSSMECEAGFVYGFRLGVQMMLQAITEQKDLPSSSGKQPGKPL